MRFFGSIGRLWREDSPSLVVIGRLGVSILGLLNAPIIARSIGPEGRGETATAAAFFYIVPVLLAIGIPLEVRRVVAVTKSLDVLRSARIIMIIAIVPSAAIAWLGYETVFASFEPEARIVASVGTILAPLTMSWICDSSALVAEGRLRALLGIQLAQPGAYLLLVLCFWLAGIANTTTVLLAGILATVFTFVTGLVLTRSAFFGKFSSPRNLLRGGVKFAGSSIAEAAANRLDQVLMLPLIGAQQSGLYSVAATIAGAPIALGHALGATYFTSVARATPSDARALKSQAIRSALVVSFLTAGVLAILTPWFVPFVFGSEFTDAVGPTCIALLGSVPMVTGFVASMVLAAQGRGVRMTIAQLISLVVRIGLLVSIGPIFGAIGAAAASSAAFLVLLVILLPPLGIRAATMIPRPADARRAIRDILRREVT